MSTHTPGPWRWTEFDERTEDCEKLVAADGTVILDLGNVKEYSPSAGTFEGTEADKRAIEATPDLLAACREVVALYNDDVSPAAKDILRAAIAKAEGR